MFYDQFKRVCEEKKKSPSTVALAVGMSKANVTNWKNGASPKLVTLQRLAEELEVPVSALLEDNVPENPSDSPDAE